MLVRILFMGLLLLCEGAHCKVFMNASMPKQISRARAGARKSLSIIASTNFGGWIPLGPIGSATMEIVLEQLIANENWLPGYNFTIEMIDDQCLDEVLLQNFGSKLLNEISPSKNRIPLTIMGYCPVKGLSFVGNALSYYNFNVLTLSLTDKNYRLYPERYTAVHQLREMADVVSYQSVVALLVKMKWHSVSIFSDDEAYFNKMEDTLLNLVENTKTSIDFIGPKLLSLNENNVAEVEKTMQTFVELQSRIFLIHTMSSVDVSCWFHRYGLYGPNFVYVASTWNVFNPEMVVIPDYLHWCTKEMLKDVIGNWIYFGMGYMTEIYGANYTDSVGLRFHDVIAKLQEKIIDSDTVSARDIWWPEVYDPIVHGLIALNEAEAFLNDQFNSSLSEWTTDSRNYAEHGEVISSVIQRAIYNVNVFGAMGHYKFNQHTKRNSDGFKPNMFYQPRYQKNGDIITYPVSYYDDNAFEIHKLNGGFLFGGSKTIPKGYVTNVPYEVDLISQPVFIALCVLAALAISMTIFFISTLILSDKLSLFSESVQNRMKIFKNQDLLKAVGLIVFLSSVLATPNGTKGGNQIILHYACQAFLLATGHSLVVGATIWKTQKAKPLRVTVHHRTCSCQIIVLLLWLICQVALIGTFIGIGSFGKIKIFHLESYYSADKNTVYKPYRYQYGTDFLTQAGPASFGIFIAIMFSNVLAMLFCIFESYRTLKLLKNEISRHHYDDRNELALGDFKTSTVSLVANSVMICGIVFIGCLLSSQPNAITLLVSISVLAISISTIVIEFSTKLATQTIFRKQSRISTVVQRSMQPRSIIRM